MSKRRPTIKEILIEGALKVMDKQKAYQATEIISLMKERKTIPHHSIPDSRTLSHQLRKSDKITVVPSQNAVRCRMAFMVRA